MRDLLAGECDLALAGGSQVWMPVRDAEPLLPARRALAARQQIRPFDKDADGTLLGEGIGMVVLKRAADAARDGDRIYAVIRGVGVASDGRGASVMAPRVEGEELALRRAYEEAGVDPAHGRADRGARHRHPGRRRRRDRRRSRASSAQRDGGAAAHARSAPSSR